MSRPKIHRTAYLFLFASILTYTFAVFAQEEAETEEDEEAIEVLIVTGTQIKGADISGILPVSVINSEDIEAMGVDSGDALFDMIPEQGQNFFNEEENISGGVNAARGDIGSFNLRNLGTGNTLVLLNGRRMVNAASYQTEEVGGSFIPVNTVNSNTLPVYGFERVELLKDGASAIYGADAVAGVVNNVLKSDLEGYKFKIRRYDYDLFKRNSWTANFEYGRYFNDGQTNIAVMGDFQTRDSIKASEDERWADSDFRRLLPEDSPWGSPAPYFRNTSVNSQYGQFDVRRSVRRLDIRNSLVDTSGEFDTFPLGHENCEWTINEHTCGAIDSTRTNRYNLNEIRDRSGSLDRINLVLFVNHEFANGIEAFSELVYYDSSTITNRHPSASFSTLKLRVGAENYYNPFGPCGSPNRLPESVIGDVPCAGLELEIDFYRFAEFPRVVEVDGTVSRLLQGFRGVSANGWDWESAVLWSRASRFDLTRNRVSNTLMREALTDPTPAAYNPFSGGVDSNLERALIDVFRSSSTKLVAVDYKMSKPDFWMFPAGPVGALVGAEFREESFADNRDPRLDGTVVYTHYNNVTFPFVSDVVNSSPTPDNDGSRRVTSLFTEFTIPISDAIDSQAALRYENFSDIGDAIVGKLAGGWRLNDSLSLRASWSQSFRVPNLVTVNERLVARQNTRTDLACEYVDLLARDPADPDEEVIDCRYSVQRTAIGSELLESETSENFSTGLVFVQDQIGESPIEDLIFTLDYWSIVKEDTIGLFGEENHTVYDLVLRLQHGNQNCDGFLGNPAVIRGNPDEDNVPFYEAAGICPAGNIARVEDTYANLDTRTLRGFDVGVKFKLNTDWGTFRFSYLASLLREFEQEAVGKAAELFAARASGVIPGSTEISGFGDLVQLDGNQKYKGTFLMTWRHGKFGGSVSQTRLGEFYQNSLTLDQGTVGTEDDIYYWVDPMSTWNARFDYRMDTFLGRTTFRVGVRNIFNERAPLADRYFGYFSDAHQDYGRSLYFDFMVSD